MDTAKQMRDIRERVNGYKLSQVLITVESLGIFAALSSGATNICELANRVGVSAERLAVLLNVLVAAGLLSRQGDTYGFSEGGSILNTNDANCQNGYIRYAANVRDRWLDLPKAVRDASAAKPNFNAITGANPQVALSFAEAMDANAKPQAEFIAQRYDFQDARILDVGAGAGTYSLTVGKKYPGSSGILMELPSMANITESFVQRASLRGRFQVVGRDYRDTFPNGGFSDVFVFAVVHQEPDANVLSLFRKAYDSLRAGGRLFVTSFFLDESRTAPPFSVMFAAEMLVMVPTGKVYTHVEIHGLLEQAGFPRIDRVDDIPGPATLYIASVLKN